MQTIKEFIISLLMFVLGLGFTLLPIGQSNLPFINANFENISLPQLSNKPVVLFVPGLNLYAKDYQTVIGNVKHLGYSVVVYHPTLENPDNYQKLIDTWSKGSEKLVANRPFIVIGHSVGGAVAVHICANNPNCVAGINMDGDPAYKEKISRPFLYLQAGIGSYCDASCLSGRQEMEKIVKPTRLPDLKHYNFTDQALEPEATTLRMEDYLGDVNGEVGLVEVNNDIDIFLHSLQ